MRRCFENQSGRAARPAERPRRFLRQGGLFTVDIDDTTGRIDIAWADFAQPAFTEALANRSSLEMSRRIEFLKERMAGPAGFTAVARSSMRATASNCAMPGW